MADPRFCMAGRNRAGAWFIACRAGDEACGAMLDRLGYTEAQSGPACQGYDSAARHIHDHGGLYWDSNARGEYRTIAGIPETGCDRRG